MTDPDPDVYLIWSHEHRAWWMPGGLGYTPRLSDAGRFRRYRALAICANAVPGTAARMGALPELPVRLLDLQDMLRGWNGEDYHPSHEDWE